MPRVISANENETLLDAFKGLGRNFRDREREQDGAGGVGWGWGQRKREREAVTNQVLYRGKKSSLLVLRKKLRLKIHRRARDPFLCLGEGWGRSFRREYEPGAENGERRTENGERGGFRAFSSILLITADNGYLDYLAEGWCQMNYTFAKTLYVDSRLWIFHYQLFGSRHVPACLGEGGSAEATLADSKMTWQRESISLWGW